MLTAAAYWQETDEAYFFRNNCAVRYRLANGESVQEVHDFATRFHGLPYTGGIDAAATVIPERRLYFFKNAGSGPTPRTTVARYSFDNYAEDTVEQTVGRFFPYLPPDWVDGPFDEVVYWPPDKCFYFFRGAHFIRYDPVAPSVSEPTFIAEQWQELTFTDIDAAFVGKRGTAYFFKGGEYIRYIVASPGRAREAARPIEGHWPPARRPGHDSLIEALQKCPEPTQPVVPPQSTSKTLQVGLNYPWAWHAIGEYFGQGKPPGKKSATMARWLTDLQSNLRYLKTELDIWHVRIFLLCNAWNYGDVKDGTSWRNPRTGLYEHNHPSGTLDTFKDPGSTPAPYTSDLIQMLQIFEAEEMKVIPSLIAYSAFHPRSLALPPPMGTGTKGNAAGGRAAIVNDPTEQKAFFEQIVEPFLRESVKYSKSIHAWEVINEPIYCMNKWYEILLEGAYFAEPDVADKDMVNFIERALTAMVGHGFTNTTTGHRFYDDLGRYPTTTGTKRQFHYYPRSAEDLMKKLGPIRDQILQAPGGSAILKADESFPLPYGDPSPLPTYAESGEAFIGEFSCKLPGDETGPWPELNGADTVDVATAVYERLRLVNDKGYHLALVWYDAPGTGYADIATPKDELKLSPEAEVGIKRFQAS